MKDFQIPRSEFSRFFWDLLGSGTYMIKELEEALEDLRDDADYKTGSISEKDVYDLTAIVSYFRPESVCEIGTFIGRSTHAIAQSMGAGSIWTCDISNSIDLPAPVNAVTIRQFKKTSSTDMLKEAVKKQQQFDLFYIDGRISSEDVDLMAKVSPPKDPIMILDDFEGVEKGVANASILLSTIASGYTLIYPRAHHKTAVLLPFSRLRFVTQV